MRIKINTAGLARIFSYLYHSDSEPPDESDQRELYGLIVVLRQASLGAEVVEVDTVDVDRG